MESRHTHKLGAYIKARRQARNLTLRGLARRSGADVATLVRLEQGTLVPRAETLRSIAAALKVSPLKVFELADYMAPTDLPTFAAYLRTKYRELPPDAVAELDHYFRRLADHYHLDLAGPRDGEDEAA